MNSRASSTSSSREAALARRRAMSSKGKQAVTSSAAERTRGDVVRTRAQTAPAAGSKPTPAARPAPATPPPSPAPVRAASGSVVPNPGSKARAAARARRAALSQSGRRAQTTNDRVRDASTRANASTTPADRKEERKDGCTCGCKKGQSAETRTPDPGKRDLSARPAGNRNGYGSLAKRANGVNKSTSRLVARARRAAMSARGKAASDTPTSAAGLARQANPRLSGRELAQKVREHRSQNGGAGEKRSPSAGRIRMERRQGAADQPWKVGASETSAGQTVTGTRVGRSVKTTGDEPSTCRTITGTEYMGADIFREFCQTEPTPSYQRVGASRTARGNRVTGNEVGRSTRVTGDEPGTCKNITGTEYISAEQQQEYCGTPPRPSPRKVGETQTLGGRAVTGVMVGRTERVTGNEPGSDRRPTGTQYLGTMPVTPAERVPSKVGRTLTLSGGAVTGTTVGRSTKVTGDEPGTCKSVTGDQYLGAEQFEAFCAARPEPEAPKVGVSRTRKQLLVSGTQTGRSPKVTGDEPGTCKAITGTPYAGLEQAEAWCAPKQQREIESRTPRLAATPGASLTGLQPGIGGVMTGASLGACETITGTPYIGADQYAAACEAAQPTDGDFPRSLELASSDQPGTGFTVTSPAREASRARGALARVTGTRYEQPGRITGPFDMGVGKITGTEQFRSDAKGMRGSMAPSRAAPGAGSAEEASAEPARSRITGEGQSAGAKITGDDWERGDRVTGTEGVSAKRRNPTRPGPMSVMPDVPHKRNEEQPQPVSRVTGSSGSTDRGALITYSGGARG